MRIVFCMLKTLYAIVVVLSGTRAVAETEAIMRLAFVDEERLLVNFEKDRLEIKENGAEVTWEEGLRLTFRESGGGARIMAPEKGYDLNKAVVLEAEIRNLSDSPVTLLGEFNNNDSSKGFLHLPAKASGILVMHLMRLEEDFAKPKPFPGMRGTPGGFMLHWDKRNRSHLIKSVEISDLDGRSVGGSVVVTSLTAKGRYGEIPPPGLTKFFPFVDEFGQYKHGSWPGKTTDVADFKKAMELELEDLAAHPGPADRSQYGGWMSGPKLVATGHFRTENYADKWWLVDPEGYLFWSHGVTGVGVGSETRVKWRKHFFEYIPEGHLDEGEVDFLGANLERKYGQEWKFANWEKSHRRLKSWGMNSAGNWSEESFCAMRKTPYFVPIHYYSKKGNAWRNADLLRDALEQRMTKEKDTINDPWCVGYFVDNELNWGEVMDPDLYYRTVSEVMKRVAPDKLYLGSRVHSQNARFGGSQEVAAAAAKYCDVVSINRYRFSPSDLRIPEGAGKPIIIGEFHFGALDRGMLHPGLRAVGDQEQRAQAYRHYLEEALKHPNIVGAHWFQYREQVVTGRSDGENFQIGFVDIADRPSSELIEVARSIGERMYGLRSGK